MTNVEIPCAPTPSPIPQKLVACSQRAYTPPVARLTDHRRESLNATLKYFFPAYL